ncbi:MAG: carbohydrate ABC transporter permease [Spirochaetales bacterium]|nr:carbohydrate ABC transporter permease [Spirochaetales bacterium]
MYKTKKLLRRFLLYTVLLFFFLIFTFPFYYVFVLATRSYDTIFNIPPPIIFGQHSLYNLHRLIRQIPFGMNAIHSTAIAILATSTRLVFCTASGFVLAKYRFPGKSLIFSFILITIMIPRFLNIIPLFKMMVWFKWVNTYLPMVIPGMADAFGIFLMTQYLSTSIPDELLDAARIDGLNEYKILIFIGFPLAKPGLGVLGTVTFIGSWNDLLYALVMLPERNMQTIPVALSSLHLMAEGDFGALMMGNALALIPLILVFIFFSKKIISHIIAGSLKG